MYVAENTCARVLTISIRGKFLSGIFARTFFKILTIDASHVCRLIGNKAHSLLFYQKESSEHHPKPLFERIIFYRIRPTSSPNYGPPTSFDRLPKPQRLIKKKKLFFPPTEDSIKMEVVFLSTSKLRAQIIGTSGKTISNLKTVCIFFSFICRKIKHILIMRQRNEKLLNTADINDISHKITSNSLESQQYHKFVELVI